MRYIGMTVKGAVLAAFIISCGCGGKEHHEARKIVLVSSGISAETSVSETSAVTDKNVTASVSYDSSVTSAADAVTSAALDNSTIVYHTKTGKKYHLLESCTGKEMLSCTLGEAKDMGLTPCRKCAVE